MLPGVGIFGSDPVCKVLIQILKHFDFEINAIWTNYYDLEQKKLAETGNGSTKANNFTKLITTSIDSVLLNKNVNLVFVCCQPNLHSQISTKALGIGKNVICIFPTCKTIDDIQQMIQSARYYPSLMSSVNYGGLKYLAEYRLLTQSLPLIGELKVCNVNISCQNLALARNQLYKKQQETPYIQPSSISNLIDHIAMLASGNNANASLNWLADQDLGAGVLNRFGASVISLVINLFEDKKCTKVFGSVRTFLDEMSTSSDTLGKTTAKNSIRKITADDFCTFQMNLEPGSVLVNVNLNSLAHSKYSQEITFCGSKGVLIWSNSKIIFRSSSKDTNNNHTSAPSGMDIIETELHSTEPVDKSAEVFLNTYKNIEEKHPELPLVFIRGLYYYLEQVKREFIELHRLKQAPTKDTNSNNNNNNPSALKTVAYNNSKLKLENFEHTRIVQTIVKSIATSSKENRWITINY